MLKIDNKPTNWKDEFENTKNRIVLTSEQLKIRGLATFGKQESSKASSPLCTHYHEDMFEFVIVSDGAFEFEIGQKNYSVKGNDIFMTFPNEVHSTASSPLSNGYFYWLQLDTKFKDSLLFLDKSASNHLLDGLFRIKNHHITCESGELKSICKNAFDACILSNDRYTAAANIVMLLYKIISYAEHPKTKITDDILSVADYINKNCEKNITLETLSDLSGLSISQFKAKFKNQLGISPRNYINKKKIELAKIYLKSGLSVTETAMRLQFDTSTYFSVVFKKYTAMTPQWYKTSHAKLFNK